MAILEGAGAIPQQSFVRWNDPQGNELVAINRDGTIFANGATFPTTNGTVTIDGSFVQATPVVQVALDAMDTTTPQSVSFTATRTTMYCTSIFLESEGAGLDSDTVVGTLTFQEDGLVDTHTFTCVLHGGAGENIVMETYPVLVEVGTVISFSTAFSAGVFAYDVSIRLVQMP